MGINNIPMSLFDRLLGKYFVPLFVVHVGTGVDTG